LRRCGTRICARWKLSRAVGAWDCFLGPLTWGVAPGWYRPGLWPASFRGALRHAVISRAFGPGAPAPTARLQTSLGQRPRSGSDKRGQSAESAFHFDPSQNARGIRSHAFGAIADILFGTVAEWFAETMWNAHLRSLEIEPRRWRLGLFFGGS